MNEVQIIRQQLATERLHFAAVAQQCATSLDLGKFVVGSEFATAACEYFAFAVRRLGGDSSTVPAPDSAGARWREFLQAFATQSLQYFETLDALSARNPLVTEWRAVSRIDADSIFAERARYERFRVAVP